MSVSNSTESVSILPSETRALGWRERAYLSGLGPDRWPFRILVLAGLALAVYAPILRDLVADWWNDPDYTHGFLVPIVAGAIFWLQRRRYSAIQLEPALSGLLIVVAALAFRVAGALAADLFTSRISLCILLAGMVIYLAGWKMLRAMAFPLAYLTLMIPLPGIIYNQVTFPMQLLASQIASRFIELIGIPVFREGNLLHVPHFVVEVAQACSGIRSFLSLVALALGYSYFADRRSWIRFSLVCIMIPIAILTNAVRVTISTLTGYWFGAEWSEGFTHLFSGWLIYLVSLGLMFTVHSLIRKLAAGTAKPIRPEENTPIRQSQPPSNSRFMTAAGVLLGTAIYVSLATAAARMPSHHPLSQLPSEMAGYRGIDQPFTQRIVEATGMDDYINRRYSDNAGNSLDLYIGYYKSQRTGDLIHSPRNCLPASGWEQKHTGYRRIEIPRGPSLTVNDFLIVKGIEKQVVFYWYQGRGRAIASEYESKFWMMSDALIRRRSDGALVRLTMHTGDDVAGTETKIARFVQDLYPHLQEFIPH